ncbi:GuaB3 family IMP dehydrogenase-related protein [Actinomycetospora lemnae]|uniref:GuaB3 family IMP dehydrogenase-related protein n=1 Tax=Actinomycetospora lemnae TaxID=3019891 RepID=A0ABT5SUS1_9PSEU|nr:GuaB3 family IMP dehydrogenase-related protein [Actinomycetospora sp. DW7H6]MDD7966600.1 GuaB3 family IMP dehydrogenase-related protein [Actinomycetospora sp. DW7H6]
MREQVEIGRGRSAQRSYVFDDLDIVPSRRTRSSSAVSTAWQLDAYRFELPLLTHPTDAVVSPTTAARVGELGGLGVLNAEGLWARHAEAEKALAEVAARAAVDPAEAVAELQRLHAAPVQASLVTEALERVRAAGATVAARVSPQHARELTPTLLAAGVEVLVVQGTIISAEHVSGDGAERSSTPGVGGEAEAEGPLDLEDFIESLDIPVVAGGVGDYRTAMHLMRTGAAGVIVGYGQSTATSTDSVLGIGVPMATALVDAAAARRDYLDETGGRYVHVIADGAMSTSGDIAKAIACGADAVMLGEQLAAAEEAPGGGWYWTPAAAHPSLPRSGISRVPTVAPDLATVLTGPARSGAGTMNLFGALRRAMAKTGYSDLKEFQRVGLSVRR